jgi:hypothetical protein
VKLLLELELMLEQERESEQVGRVVPVAKHVLFDPATLFVLVVGRRQSNPRLEEPGNRLENPMCVGPK